tara:strand:- start:818 stop:1402 length:585 start_codon:yes stop_codon:yes gene_type:complete
MRLTFYIIIFTLIFYKSVFAKDRYFLCNFDYKNDFSLSSNNEITINLEKKILLLDINQFNKNNDIQSEYPRFTNIDLNQVLKVSFDSFDDDFIFFNINIYPFGFKKILKENLFYEKEIDYFNYNEQTAILYWFKYFENLKEGSINDNSLYLNFIKLKFDRKFHKIYILNIENFELDNPNRLNQSIMSCKEKEKL